MDKMDGLAQDQPLRAGITKKGCGRMIEYNEDYCEKFRTHTVNTRYSTLTKLRPLFKELGLAGLLKDGTADTKSLLAAVETALGEKNLVNEFCQTVTGKTEKDFNEAEAGEVFWVINDFFTAYWWQMPPSWRAWIRKSLAFLQEWGKAMLPVPVNQPSQPGSETQITG